MISIYIYREREREITLYDIIEHFYNTRIIQIFATHFPGMKNQRGGSYFSFHGKHAVLILQIEGWPHRQVLDVSWSCNCPNVFRCLGQRSTYPRGLGGCRVFATYFPRMKNERGGPVFHFIEVVGLASCTAVKHTPQRVVAGFCIFH